MIKYSVGKFCFRYAPKIFDRYTSAEGFLFLQDDTILNYWNLLQADKSKLWIANKVSTNMKSLFLVFSGRFLLIVTCYGFSQFLPFMAQLKKFTVHWFLLLLVLLAVIQREFRGKYT